MAATNTGNYVTSRSRKGQGTGPQRDYKNLCQQVGCSRGSYCYDETYGYICKPHYDELPVVDGVREWRRFKENQRECEQILREQEAERRIYDYLAGVMVDR